MDSTNIVAARQHPGCFTANEIRQFLGQASTERNSPDTHEGDAHGVTAENHWIPDCICAPLHARCLAPDSPPQAASEPSSSASSSSGDSGDSGDSEDSDSDGSGSSANANITITLDQLRQSSQSACWFCSVIYAGLEAMPPWDPTMPTPSRTSFRLKGSKSGISATAYNEAKGYPSRVPEPDVVFYVDCNRGR